MTLQLRVYVPPHPLIKHWLAVARDTGTPSVLFRSAMTELGRWLTYEAARDWLPTQEIAVQTPLDICPATVIDPQIPVAVVPILRAGLGLLEGAQTLLPLASIYHLGLARDEETLQPHCYLNKLPEKFDPQTRVLITDPSLIRIVCVVAAPPALQKLSAAYPGLIVYTATIDEKLNSKGYIVPGLGDAGDRIFGT
jgi:uracil phosphoribosyltransferase